jgi:histidinol-phosphate aminotransferase
MVHLASNENPLGCSPFVAKALTAAFSEIHRYPRGGHRVRNKLADFYSTHTQNLIVGNGSDSILVNILRTFLCPGDEVLASESTFSGFRVAAASVGVPYRAVPYRDWHIDLAGMAKAVNERTKIIYLPNPNNPTGTTFTRDEFEPFHRQVPEDRLIVLDEAYYEYAAGSEDYPDSLHYRYDNVVTLRTFSKAYGLAGLRIGYGLADSRIIDQLLKVKLPFEPNVLAEAATLAALDDQAFVARTVALNRTSRQFLTESMRSLGYNVVASRGNFVMVIFPEGIAAETFRDALYRSGIQVRHLGAFGIPQGVRISTGTQAEMEACASAAADARHCLK